MEILLKALLDGDQAGSIKEASRLLEAGASRRQIVMHGVEAAMEQLDAKCTVQQFNLLEIMLCGRAATGVMRELYPSDVPPAEVKGAVVLGTPEGDVHDLGKNIFKTVLAASGYRAVDCGKDCPLDALLDTAERMDTLAIGVSGLITAVIPQVRQIRDRMSERGLQHIKLVAGGAALKQATAESLKVDFVAQSAFDGIHYLNQLVGAET